MSIRRIRLALREGRYEYSIHALEEMDEDGLIDSDVYDVIMRGKVVAKLTGDARGTRFVVRGLAMDKAAVQVEFFVDLFLRQSCV